MKKTIEKKKVHSHAHAHPRKKHRKPEDTQVAAYFFWKERGEPVGDDLDDWVRAERLWENELDVDDEDLDVEFD